MAAEDAECLGSPSAVDAAFVTHFTAGNIGHLIANHTETGARMAPGLPSHDGRDQVAAYLQMFVEAYAEREIELTETGEVIEAELGYTWGQYRVSSIPVEGGEPVERAGKYVAVSQLGDDGCWRNEWVLWNGDEPWPGAGA
jgi:ketosteroid isomerase-like protein